MFVVQAAEKPEGKRVSAIPGVTWNKQTQKWWGEIIVDGRVQVLGSSTDEVRDSHLFSSCQSDYQ